VGRAPIELSSLAHEDFVMFPRELAPRLYDSLVGICRRAGFEPSVRSESFHTSWETGVLADVPAVALVPASVARGAPKSLVAVELSDRPQGIETAIVWRTGEQSPVAAAFREVAGAVFDEAP
jgi:DNA-binding transcriptional LysR family regulator